MFDSGLYTRTYPKNGELTVCSVIFPNDDNTYLYLQDRCFLKVGDHVRIPFGPEDKYTTGTIVKIECLLPEQLPVSVDQIKHITSEPYKSSIHSMALVYKKQHWQEIMESTRE